MASSIVRWCYKTAKNPKFGLTCCSRLGSIGAMSKSCSIEPPPPPPSTSYPWLMLPPALEGDNMIYNFYCPAKDKTLSFNKTCGAGEIPPHDAKFVGSSHGWLALFDENSNHVFLSNPISGQHVKLPAIDTLPHPEVNLLAGRGQVSKVILSCSPLEDECRALISYGPKDRLAVCAPRAAAAKWTYFGDLYWNFSECTERISDREIDERNYEDFVYSRTHDLFFCITERYSEVEAWDLRDPLSPKLAWMIPGYSSRLDRDNCLHPKYLVFSDDLYVVMRHVIPRLRPDGSAADRIYFFGNNASTWDHRYPYKTVGFDVFRVDREFGKPSHIEGSLQGMAIFVGMNHSFAVMAKDFPELKADSIYFTDEDRRITSKSLARTSFGGHDNGVFDYRERTISSICSYYPVEYENIRRIVPPPMWFTPSVLNVT